jgi:choline dehydrogenase-like flavoprotein
MPKKFDPNEEVDFVIIGSGAGGGVMAKKLSQAGFSCVVLEQGPWASYGHEESANKDELLNRFPSPEQQLLSNPAKQVSTFRRTAAEKAQIFNNSYGCTVGGGTVTYGASNWRHLPWEFDELSRFGGIPGANLADWPVKWDEMEKYYTQAEWEIGVSGQRINTPFMAPMSKPYPLPPQPQKASGALLRQGAAKLGWFVAPNAAAILTQPYMGRAACNNCGMCSGYTCQVKARSSSAVALLPFAEATGNCEIRPNSYVHTIKTDGGSKVTGAVYFETENGNREVFQKAKVVVLSANGMGSPRLLLLSANNQYPNGLANTSGVVGKNLMSGNGGGATGLFEQPLNEYKGCVTGAAVLSFVPNDVKNRGFYGGGRMTARGQQSPIEYGLAGPHDAPSWGADYKKALAAQTNRKLSMSNFISTIPVETNRVDLDPDVKDPWGLPAMRITQKSHDNDLKAVQFFIDRSVDVLKAAGATQVWAGEVGDSRGGAHSRATCRMGNDPKTSVVNKYHRAHDVDNLFVIDNSSFVTGGRNHPTLTTSALAFRAADYLVKAAKTGNVKI